MTRRPVCRRHTGTERTVESLNYQTGPIAGIFELVRTMYSILLMNIHAVLCLESLQLGSISALAHKEKMMMMSAQ